MAVKVLHPGIADLIEMDLELMSLIVSVISFLVKDAEFLSMRDALQHFSASMRLQSNLTVEARNLEIFNEYFKGIQQHPTHFFLAQMTNIFVSLKLWLPPSQF